MARYFVQDTSLTAIADAIRSKTGGTDALTLDGMAEAVAGIQTGGGGGDDLLNQIVARTVTECSDATITSAGIYAFYNCTRLTSVSLPACMDVGNYAFSNCTSLTSVNLPTCTSFGTYAFGVCSKLESISLPACTVVSGNMFSSCNKLASVDLSVCRSVGKNAFNGCYSLTSVCIRSESMCNLVGTTAFTGCHHFLGTVSATYNPDGLKDGYIYVPDGLVDSYKTATNWSTFADQIKPLSEYVEVTA